MALEQDGARFCRLEEAVGRQRACPEEACAFWERGEAAVDGWCVLEDVDFSREPGLAEWLLDFRGALQAAPADHTTAGREFRRVLSQGRE